MKNEPPSASSVTRGSETPRCTELIEELDHDSNACAYEKLLITRQLAKQLERELIDATVLWTREQEMLDWLMTGRGLEWITEAPIITRETLLTAFQNNADERRDEQRTKP